MRSDQWNDLEELSFIMTQKHNRQMFGIIPFVKLQHDTWTTVKGLQTMKNEMKNEITFVAVVVDWAIVFLSSECWILVSDF